jgi:Flavodoxins
MSTATVSFNTIVFGTLELRHKSSPQHVTAAAAPRGKALIFYQPARTDVTKKAAFAIAKCLSEDGFDVTIDFPGGSLGKDVSEYDIVAFGTPVYADRGSPLIADAIRNANGLDGKILLLFTTGYNMTDKAFIGLDRYTQQSKITKKFKFVLKNGNNDKNIQETAEQYVGNLYG